MSVRAASRASVSFKCGVISETLPLCEEPAGFPGEIFIREIAMHSSQQEASDTFSQCQFSPGRALNPRSTFSHFVILGSLVSVPVSPPDSTDLRGGREEQVTSHL